MEIGNLNVPFQYKNKRKKIDKVCNTVWIRIVDESKPVPRHIGLYKNQELNESWGRPVQDDSLLISLVRADIPLITPVGLNVLLDRRYSFTEMFSEGSVSSRYIEYFSSGWSP